MRISLLVALLPLLGSLPTDGGFQVERFGADEWFQCSRSDQECQDAQNLFALAGEFPSIAQIYELAQSTVSFLHTDEVPADRQLTPVDRMMRAVYLEAKMNFPLVFHSEVVSALKNRGIEVGERLQEPSDAAAILLSQAETIHYRPMALIVKGMLRKTKNPISLIFDSYTDKFSRIHCLFILQYALGHRPTAMFWKNHIFPERPSGLDIYQAFVNGLLEDEAHLRDKMGIQADVPNLFARNLVAVSIGGASDLSEEQKNVIMDGDRETLGLVALLDIFRQRQDTSRTTIVNLRCSSGGQEPKYPEISMQWYEVECGMLQSHHIALEAFSNTRLQSLSTGGSSDLIEASLSDVVNVSNLFGFSQQEALAAAESYRAFVKALQMSSVYRNVVTEKTSHLMWTELLDTTLGLPLGDSFMLLLRHYIAVPFNATYVQLTHSLLTDIDKEQMIPLNARILNALLTVQINGPPLREFNPRASADVWLHAENIGSDDENSNGILRRDDDLGGLNFLIAEGKGNESGEEWKEQIAKARKEFSANKLLDKIDFSFD